ncbi:hypothetical protein PROFUN_09014 [Planoprotostelium fungivorum]|uniref:BZIP domain-containing protein n=1 Tax=Planoprotostelium fungivorum TaxID=1890364 RepID=A0A2P6MUY4_9EUKA|nr:hypothetical protein PROFUN_09014 [Planoprotostelium fungivorum]
MLCPRVLVQRCSEFRFGEGVSTQRCSLGPTLGFLSEMSTQAENRERANSEYMTTTHNYMKDLDDFDFLSSDMFFGSELSSDILIQSGGSEDDSSPTAFPSSDFIGTELLDDTSFGQIDEFISLLTYPQEAQTIDAKDDTIVLDDIIAKRPPPAVAPSAFNSSMLPPLPEIKTPKVETPTEPKFDSSTVKTKTPSPNASPSEKKLATQYTWRTGKGGFTEMSSDEIQALTGEEIEIYIKDLRARKNVTASQDKELKRIRRLIKNREYAQNSRDKKRVHLEVVEGEMNVIKEENAELKRRLQQLEEHNAKLEQTIRNIDPDYVSAPTQERDKKRRRGLSTGTSLFVVFFSLALLFSFDSVLHNNVFHHDEAGDYTSKESMVTKDILEEGGRHMSTMRWIVTYVYETLSQLTWKNGSRTSWHPNCSSLDGLEYERCYQVYNSR